MQFSFTKGDPIATIKGGKDDGKTLRLYDPAKKCCSKCSDDCLTAKKKCCKECEVSQGGCGCSRGGKIHADYDELLRKVRQTRKQDRDVVMARLREQITQMLDPRRKSSPDEMPEYRIEDGGKLAPLPNKKTRQVSYVSAPAGAGKSTYSANLAKEYHKMFPKNQIFLFSRLDEDESIDKIPNLTRIKLDDELLNSPIDPTTMLRDCLVIFDDTDTLRDKVIRDELYRVLGDILEIGRHPSTYCIVTSHMMMNYQATRNVINESHQVTFFPEFTPTHHIHRYLRTYGGLTDDQIEHVKNLPSRWVTLNAKGPRYILHEKGAILLKNIGKKVKSRAGKKKSKAKSIDTDESGTESEDEEVSE